MVNQIMVVDLNRVVLNLCPGPTALSFIRALDRLRYKKDRSSLFGLGKKALGLIRELGPGFVGL